ncbi:MAG: NADH-quinone oxidoreductase subunit A, partial [candidate division KSB1 bacterium]|nr:NADH-quinone oxidoreductase subunit A [candidate division KSB1 bacterium]
QLKKIPTICSYCSTGCTITLGIKQNEIIRSVGNENIGLNTGNLCIKGRYGFEYVNSSERLTSPLVKKNGQLIPTSWKEALGWVAQRLNQIKEQHGGQSIAGLCSERITNEEAYLFQKFMRVVIGTNHIDHGGGYSYQGLVQGLKEALGYAASTNSISEIRKAEVLLVLRSNISETHPVIGYEVNVAVKRHEAKLIVADCRKVKLSYFPGLFLYHKPGTEVALINGMLHVILKEDLWDKSFVEAHTEGLSVLKKALRKYTPHYVSEVCGVPQEALIKAARTFAQAKRALIFISAGLGLPSTNVELARAALNLILLTGNLGRESAGIFLLPEKSNSQGLLDMGVTPQFLPGLQAVSDNQIRKKFEETWKASLPKEPGMNALQILENAERGKIKALYIVGENPVVTYPGQAQTIKALEKVDFLVVQDLFLTPTAQLADVVLPAVSFAEKEGTYTNAERRVQRLMPAILPHAEARSDLSIFTELSRQMGYLLTPITPSEVMEEIRQLVPMYRGIHYARLTNGGVQWPCPEPDHPGTPFLSESIFASKRIPFLPVEFEDPVEDGAKEYPFVLITGSTLFHSGSLSVKAPGLTMVAAENQVELNPQDAEKLAIVEGDLVRVISRYGEITIRAKITEKTNSGTIFIPYHFEQPCVNALTDKQLKFTMINQYLPILIVMVFAVGFAGTFLLISYYLGPRKNTPEKLSVYECGIDPVTDARGRFPVKFYLTAVLFLIFDIEVVFLYPWAVQFRKLGWFGFVEMMVFLFILFVGLIYVWKKGALEWD